MKIAFGILVALLALFLVYVFVLITPRLLRHRSFPKELFTDYAHRGLYGGTIPENSLAAFRGAIEHGHGFELDVQLSKDGEVMVFHDAHLGRMTGVDRFLNELTADELRKLRLNGSDEKIPFLSEVLSLCDGRVPILVELKGETGDTSVCPPTDALLSAYKGLYCVESFNPLLLRWYKKNRPEVMRGILVTDFRKEKGKTFRHLALTTLLTNPLCRPDFIAYNVGYTNFSIDMCTKLFSSPAFAWTVRNERDYYRAREYNAFVIFEAIKPNEDDRPQH